MWSGLSTPSLGITYYTLSTYPAETELSTPSLGITRVAEAARYALREDGGFQLPLSGSLM